ncbi:hypothetical protein DFH09DRAFT_1067624 [Mycena vulgaris]|nr:hypothetical protein DFH09DRAFT_1067624 [Mycena vulgaris]
MNSRCAPCASLPLFLHPVLGYWRQPKKQEIHRNMAGPRVERGLRKNRFASMRWVSVSGKKHGKYCLWQGRESNTASGTTDMLPQLIGLRTSINHLDFELGRSFWSLESQQVETKEEFGNSGTMAGPRVERSLRGTLARRDKNTVYSAYGRAASRTRPPGWNTDAHAFMGPRRAPCASLPFLLHPTPQYIPNFL